VKKAGKHKCRFRASNVLVLREKLNISKRVEGNLANKKRRGRPLLMPISALYAAGYLKDVY